MTGLLIKDWKLLKNQGKSILILFAFACIVMVVGSDGYASFLTSYLTFMMAIYTFSSFSYDEYENGMDYLIALPTGRKDYVKAKYLFCFMVITVGWLIASLLRIGMYLTRYSWEAYMEIVPEEPVYLLVVLMFVSLSIPFLLQFGVEKGRMMSFMGLVVGCFSVYLIAKIERLRVAVDAFLTRPPVVLFLAILVAVTAAVMGISYLVSIWIMNKKEF